MKDIIKQILFLFLFSIITILSDGQARSRVNDEIADKFLSYCRALPREEVYLHTDRDEFIAGEIVWMNAYLFDRFSSELSNGSNILYVELLNPGNIPVVQRKFSIRDGCCPGFMELPDTLSQGTYILRAYTNWMKNFLPANCFMKEIRIYNTFSSKRLSGTAGTGLNLPEKSGMHRSDTLSGTGIDLKVNYGRKDSLEIVISTSENFRILNGSLCYLFIQTHGAINFNEPVKLYTGNSRILLSKIKLTPGINQIVVFNPAGIPITSRYIYTPEVKSAEPSISSQDSFQKRSRVILEIDPGNLPGSKADQVRLSVSVASGPFEENKGDMYDYLVFGSEFGALPDDIRDKKLSTLKPEIIDNFLRSAKSDWIDWTAILTGNYPELKYKMEKEYHSLPGILISKASETPDTGQYIFISRPGKTAYFQYAMTNNEGRFSFTIPSQLSGSDVIIQPADPDRNDMIRMESSFSNVMFPVNNNVQALPREMPPYAAQWSINYQAERIFGSTPAGDTIKQAKGTVRISSFYGKPDIALIMDQYIKLPVMQEVFFELMPGVYLKNKKSSWDMTIADPVDFSIYKIPPLLLIDGVVVHDASIIANLDPELVQEIDAVKDKYIIGNYLIYGLVDVITRKGNFSCVSLPDYAIRTIYRTSDPVCSFKSPDYSDQAVRNNHIPDFRNTMWWNPSLEKDKDGKFRAEFYTSDMTSDYVINIQGVDSENNPFSLRKVIRVK
ncbi:MAG: hypothetical protein ABSG89_04825 [Bacteroidales bacterium]|jgi:hypothetical protein